MKDTHYPELTLKELKKKHPSVEWREWEEDGVTYVQAANEHKEMTWVRPIHNHWIARERISRIVGQITASSTD